MESSNIRQIRPTTRSLHQNNQQSQQSIRRNQENLFTHNAQVSRDAVIVRSQIEEIDSNNSDSKENPFLHISLNRQIKYMLNDVKEMRKIQDYIEEQIKNGTLEEKCETRELNKNIFAINQRIYFDKKNLAKGCHKLAEEADAKIGEIIQSFSGRLAKIWREPLPTNGFDGKVVASFQTPIFYSHPYVPTQDEVELPLKYKLSSCLYETALSRIRKLQQIISEQNHNLDKLGRSDLKIKISNYPIYRLACDYYNLVGFYNRPPYTPFGASSGDSRFPRAPFIRAEY